MNPLTPLTRGMEFSRLSAAMKRGRSFLLVAVVALVSAGLLCLVGSRRMGERAPLDGSAKKVTAGGGQQAVSQSSGEQSASLAQHAAAYNNLPLSFEANEGQTDARVKFYSRGRGYGLFLTPTEAVLALRDSAPTHGAGDMEGRLGKIEQGARRAHNTAVLKMELKGASAEPSVKGVEELPGKVNYFVGRGPEDWRTGIRNYAKVRYESVYPGIDLVYYGKQQELEYDFVLAPGADPRSIRLGFQGTRRPVIDEQGELVLRPTGGGGDVRFHKPTVYQEAAGVRREVAARYVLRKGLEVGFEVGDYDPREPLVIDPVLSYSTFYGGSSSEEAHAIAVDAEGNAYVTGYTLSSDFPVVGGLPYGFHSDSYSETFVLKLNPAGSAALYSTYLGGAQGGTVSYSIAVDAGGNAYVVGITNSTNFPVVNAVQATSHGNYDGFVAKLNPSGSQLLYSTYLGGSGPDGPSTVALDASGNAYVAGYTSSIDFPTAHALQPTRHHNTVLKSVNGGGLWMGSGNGMNAYTANHLLIDPAAPSTIYAATDNGVFKSTDSGGNWTGVGQNQIPKSVNRLAINPINSSTIYAATSNGIYKSTDGGNNWTSSGLAGNPFHLLAINPLNPSILYTARTDLPRIYRSVDGGNTWTLANNGIFFSNTINSLTIDPTNPSIIYAGTTGGGAYQSKDGGDNWTNSSSSFRSPAATIYDIAVDRNSPATLYATASGAVYKSTSGGLGWTKLPSFSNYIYTWLAIDPANSSTVYVGTRSSGILKSSNGGSNWEPLNEGLVVYRVLSLAIDPSNTSTLYLGTENDAEGFITKLNPAGDAFVYSTYLGGNGTDIVNCIAVDDSGEVFITGRTTAPDFPVANAYQGTLKDRLGDAFIAKLNPAGSQLLYSTYFGGGRGDYGNGIAIDAGGNAYVAGHTYSADFPTLNPVQGEKAGTTSYPDAFVMKINASGGALFYSTYLGGYYDDIAYAIAVDAGGNAYIAGSTDGGLPGPGGVPPEPGPGADAFLARLNAAGALAYSGYLGGYNYDDAYAIALDSFGNVYLVGSTYSENFPTVAALDSTLSGYHDAFIAKFAAADDLAVKMAETPNFVYYGDNLTYTIAVTNSEGTATGVTLTDNLPPGSTLVSASTSQGSCSGAGPVICSLGDMSGGAGATITIVIKPPASKSITNTAIVTRNEPEVNRSNNTASVSTQVRFADLSVSKSTFVESVAPGSKIVYHLTVRNTSGFESGFFTLTDNLPAELAYVSCFASGAEATCEGTGNNRSVRVRSLAEGASVTVLLAASVNNSVAPGTVINNTASVSPSVPDPNPSNNSAQKAITVTSNPVGLRQNGRIAAYSLRASANPAQPNGIYTINPDGTGESLLVNLQSFTAPAWSPDGTLIAYVRDGAQLYVAKADGTNPLLLASDVANYNMRIAWSPSDKRVAYVSTDTSIHLVSADGTLTERLPISAPSGGINDLSWSPDGYTLTYSDGVNIFKVNVNGGGEVNLTQSKPRNNGETTRNRYPRWSPDGKRLLFQADSQNYSTTFMINADGSGLTQLFDGSNAEAPAWSPDGTKIVYVSRGSLYVANADGTNQTRVTNNGFNNFYPDWQPLAPLPGLQFSAASYSVAENAGVATITVMRGGDTSQALTVDYATSDGTAKQRTDYTIANGTLAFAPGETSKSFIILLTDNAYMDGARTVNLSLVNPAGAFLASPSVAVLTITDNDTAPPTANPIDDAQFFVRQQYADFLNRAPDAGGLGYWSNEINRCGTDAECTHDRRVAVADAFFFEAEFQQTGGYLYRVYKAALGQRPSYGQFTSDRGHVVVGFGLDQSKLSFALNFVQRDAFLALYPRSLTADQFVDALLANIKQNSGVDLTGQRASLVSLYDGKDTGRAAILKRVADSQGLIDAEYNQSFVLMEYFGYLRRDPDQGGFDFWLAQVNKFPLRNVDIQHAMACSFITSTEYQTRFSSVVTHSNRECPQ